MSNKDWDNTKNDFYVLILIFIALFLIIFTLANN